MQLIRIVRMTFQKDKVGDFLDIFQRSRKQIRHFPGCLHLELWQDYHLSHVYLTHSHWESEEALNRYRQSSLFIETWAQTKVLFFEKPLVFSVRKLEEIK
jgi:heme-degrading monooxygenase HmoA